MLRLVHSTCLKIIQPKTTLRFPTRINFASTQAKSELAAADSTELIPVYKFPYIRIFGLINRIKLYQTVLTVGSIPVSVILSTTNLVDKEFWYAVSSLGVSGCIVMYTFGFLTNKFVGFVYINNNNTEVKISYADFWGRRRDKHLPINDIIPLSDMSASITDQFYLKCKTYSSAETLRLNLKFGQILDKEGFNRIFSRDV